MLTGKKMYLNVCFQARMLELASLLKQQKFSVCISLI